METLKIFLDPGTKGQLTLFPAASPVKIFLSAEEARVFMGVDHPYGMNTIDAYRKFYLDMSLLKTPQTSLTGVLKKSYMTFPESGMMQNGNVFSLPSLGETIRGSAFIYLPTPMFKDGEGYYISSKESSLKRIGKSIHWVHNAILFYNLKKGIANPLFSEWLMGLPENWTHVKDLERSETL